MIGKMPTFVAATLAITLGACQQQAPQGVLGSERHKVEVTQRVDSIKVPFLTNSAKLVPSAQDGLQGFFRRIGADRDAVIVVHAPLGLRGDLDDQRRNAVLRFLRSAGFSPVARDALMPRAEPAQEAVLVQVAQYDAVLPQCPDHTRTTTGGFTNQPASNFSCATNRNLGAMVANPRDLIRGRDLALARTTRQMHRIDTYRSGGDVGGDTGGGAAGGGTGME